MKLRMDKTGPEIDTEKDAPLRFSRVGEVVLGIPNHARSAALPDDRAPGDAQYGSSKSRGLNEYTCNGLLPNARRISIRLLHFTSSMTASLDCRVV